jgi:hypothetical protein
MMDEAKYKTTEKGKLARLAGDLQKVLGARGIPAESSPPEGEEGTKKSSPAPKSVKTKAGSARELLI